MAGMKRTTRLAGGQPAVIPIKGFNDRKQTPTPKPDPEVHTNFMNSLAEQSRRTAVLNTLTRRLKREIVLLELYEKFLDSLPTPVVEPKLLNQPTPPDAA